MLKVSELALTAAGYAVIAFDDPREALEVGQEVEVEIISVDPDRKRIGLSMKRREHDPWASVVAQYQIGQLAQATVTKLTKFGAFARLVDAPEIEGLIHISELADTHVKAVTDKVKPGDEVDVRVLAVDTVNKKISLSMKTPPREPTPEELAEIAARRAAAEKEQAKKRAKQASRRGGITIEWDQGLGSLDPSKFARS